MYYFTHYHRELTFFFHSFLLAWTSVNALHRKGVYMDNLGRHIWRVVTYLYEQAFVIESIVTTEDNKL